MKLAEVEREKPTGSEARTAYLRASFTYFPQRNTYRFERLPDSLPDLGISPMKIGIAPNAIGGAKRELGNAILRLPIFRFALGRGQTRRDVA